MIRIQRQKVVIDKFFVQINVVVSPRLVAKAIFNLILMTKKYITIKYYDLIINIPVGDPK